MENMYLTLPSNTTGFPGNTPAKYGVRLPNPVELTGEWEMALVEIQYPHSWDNINDKPTEYSRLTQNSFFLYLKPLPQQKHGLLVRYEIPVGTYDTIDGLVEALNISLATWEFTAPELLKYNSKKMYLEEIHELSEAYRVVVEEKGAPAMFEYLEKNRRIELTCQQLTSSILMSSLLQYVLGVTGDRWVPFEAGDKIVAKYPPDLTAGFNTLFVYCNLIEPQVVGNSLVPILRTVTIEGKHGDFINKIFLSPHYAKLRTKTFDTVEIAIKTDTDQEVQFNFGKVIVKLHLRRVQPR
jgi:hypothetical protein